MLVEEPVTVAVLDLEPVRLGVLVTRAETVLDWLGVPVRDPDPVSEPDSLAVCVAVRLPVTVAVTVRLLVLLGFADRVLVEEGVMAAVPVREREAVRLPV